MTVRGYRLLIDWANNGTFTDAYDDVSSQVDKGTPIEVSWGRDQANTQNPMATAGKISFGLINHTLYWTRRFSPENTASPLYGKVMPGRRGRYEIEKFGSIYTLLDGVLDNFEIDSTRADKLFSGEILDAWGRPKGEKLSTPVYQGIRTGTAIGLTLDAIGWTGLRDIDAGVTVMPYWWEEGTDAATAVEKLVDSEGPPSIAYVQGNTFVFRDRHHRIMRTASSTVQATFSHAIPAGSGPAGSLKILKGATYDHGQANLIRTVDFAVDQRATGAMAAVWTSDSPLTVPAGTTVPVAVSGSDPFLNAITPVQDVDYVLQSGAVTVTLSRTSGQSATIFVTATGGVAAVVASMQLRAQSIPVVRSVKVSSSDTTSPGGAWPREAPWANAYDAQAIADRIITMFAQNRPVVTFTVMAVNDTYLANLLARKIGDRVRLKNDDWGVDREFIIERLTHRITAHGAIHTVTFGCQSVDPGQPANVFTFDTAGRGFNDGAFGVLGVDNYSTMFLFDTAGQGFNQGLFAS